VHIGIRKKEKKAQTSTGCGGEKERKADSVICQLPSSERRGKKDLFLTPKGWETTERFMRHTGKGGGGGKNLWAREASSHPGGFTFPNVEEGGLSLRYGKKRGKDVERGREKRTGESANSVSQGGKGRTGDKW